MDRKKIDDINVESSAQVLTPAQLHAELPASDPHLEVVEAGRQTIRNILEDKDDRLFIVIGPCSVHDPKAALEYAEQLKGLADRVRDRFYLIMRVYFEKPRTTVGWKGMINDPSMDDSFQVEEGLRWARRLLLDITGLGLPTSTEALDPVTPQYIGDLLSWSAIGARTTESQTHREMASGLSTPVGFKNGTDGNILVAINAMKSSLNPHHFLGIDAAGRIAVFQTRGNPHCHVVLRGSDRGPNFDPKSLAECQKALHENKLPEKIMVDCSHGNSNKDHERQPGVFEACIEQVQAGNNALCGIMVESNLFAGNQKIPKDLSQLKYGVSVTDKCIDWETTERMILEGYSRLG